MNRQQLVGQVVCTAKAEVSSVIAWRYASSSCSVRGYGRVRIPIVSLVSWTDYCLVKLESSARSKCEGLDLKED